MDGASPRDRQSVALRRRWLLGFEPFFEGGWFHKGARARTWDVEERLNAVALFGDVIVDLAASRNLPASVELHAYAVLRDIEVCVPEGTVVEVTGLRVTDHVSSDVPDVAGDGCAGVLQVISHAFRGDVTIRVSGRI